MNSTSLINAFPPLLSPKSLPGSVAQHSTLNDISSKAGMAPKLGVCGGAPDTGLTRPFDPRQATSLGRSVLFAIAGFCAGASSGVAITMLLWSGLKDRFSSGVAADAAGSATASGDIDANGTFDAGGGIGIDNVEGNVLGWNFGVPASGGGDFAGQGELDFDGDFQSSGLGLDFEGDAAVDIGGFAPWKVITSVALVFGIVVAAFAWLGERQLASAESQAELLRRSQPSLPLPASPDNVNQNPSSAA